MNINDMSTQLLYTTLPIWIERQSGTSFGTAFFFSVPLEDRADRQIPLLVTNYHVVKGARRGLVELVERDGDRPKKGGRVRVEIPGDAILKHNRPESDLAVLPVGGILNELEHSGRPVFFRSITPDLVPTQTVIDDLAAVEEITFVGYPSGLYDQHNATPLVRRGITATPPWNDFQDQPAFLIDAGVFPGSSGSPVFILNQGSYAVKNGIAVGNRLLFMGVLTEAILRKEADLPSVFLGIGRVTKSAELLNIALEVATELRQADEGRPTPR